MKGMTYALVPAICLFGLGCSSSSSPAAQGDSGVPCATSGTCGGEGGADGPSRANDGGSTPMDSGSNDAKGTSDATKQDGSADGSTMHGDASDSGAAPHACAGDGGPSTDDGFGNAPAGTPQFPHLLDAYSIRPAWKVAGVDYAVGIPTGTVLKDPASINLTGVTIDTASHEVWIDTDNVTLDGYDFSLSGGWQVILGAHASAANATLTSSNFAIGSNGNALLNMTGGASNLLISYCVLDGNDLQDNLNTTLIDASNGLTVKYSLLENAGGDFVDYGATILLEYNVFNNDGQLAGTHPDWLQLGGGTYPSVSVHHNTVLQTAAMAGPGTQGFGVGGFGTWSVGTADVAYNTMVTLAGAQVSYFVSVDPKGLTGSAAVHDNYADPTGLSFGENCGKGQECGFAYPGSTSPISTYCDNINLTNGTQFPTTY
jgi:hypothetical protein